MNQINEIIQKIQNTQGKVVIAIDGRCGAGKTTLGNYLSTVLDANLFHMDDYFLRPIQRTKERYEEPGGNVDRERFKEEIGDLLHTDKDIVYTPFDCKTMALTSPIHIKQKRITIVEGSYSLHPYLRDLYDISIFMTISDSLRIERIQKRNPDKVNDFINKWIPLEERYFLTYEIEDTCDYVLLADALKDDGELVVETKIKTYGNLEDTDI